MMTKERSAASASSAAKTLIVATMAGVAASVMAASAGQPAPVEPAVVQPSGGNGTLYLGGWPNRIYIFDEASEKQVGEIPLTQGAPRFMDLSRDGKRFYVLSTTLQDVEVVDLAARKVVDRIRLSEPNKRVWIRSLTADPQHRFLVLLTKTATKQVDRFEIGAPTLQVYDLRQRKVSRTIAWPDGEEREFARILMSPDGRYLYFFSEDVLIYETADFKQVDKWELSRPTEEGLGRFDFGPMDTTYEEPGFYTGIFFVRDPVQNRRLMGIARMDLVGKRVDFHPIGPARSVSFALAPDRKRGYGLLQEIGHYEFWGFDLERRQVLNRVEFQGRPRMALRVSSNGKLLYISSAGNTIDVYDAGTYRHLRRMTLDFDGTTDLHVVSAASAGRWTVP
jgi:hypothetical protein